MIDYNQLRTLLAVDEAGSFEGAARALGMSSFAISNRIKTLEKSLNVVLIERAPTRTSDAGKILCEHMRKVSRLEDKVLATRQSSENIRGEQSATIHVAMNEYCLEHGIGDVFTSRLDIGISDDDEQLRFQIKLADPSQSHRLMQSGDVQAGISIRKEAIHGFKSYRLSPVTYHAVATLSFMNKYFDKGVNVTALSKAPCYRHCQDDNLAKQWAQSHVKDRCKLSIFKYPFNEGALQICLNGNAWTMLPLSIIQSHLTDGALVELIPGTAIIQELYWHVSGTLVRDLEPITKQIKIAAAEL